ncbi:MAG: AAA family ATPase [Gammaproteobacteria bacterium]
MSNPAETLHREITSRIGTTAFGVEAVAHAMLTALIARGHVLLQGYPGLGKTLLARAFARCIGGQFERVQCTADLMPADLTGVHVLDAATGGFTLRRGPLFGDVVLVDELNRTGPKTQSAMLQAMEERAIAIDRTVYPLCADFMIIATQNPHEFEGTYPLPESQLDRFLLLVNMPYPPRESELAVLAHYDKPNQTYQQRVDAIEPVDHGLVAAAREQAAAVGVVDAVYDYALRIAEASRRHGRVSLGLSTRGVLALVRCARAAAAIDGRGFVSPDDIKSVATRVVPHRLVLAPEAILDGVDPAAVVADVLAQTEVPRG